MPEEVKELSSLAVATKPSNPALDRKRRAEEAMLATQKRIAEQRASYAAVQAEQMQARKGKEENERRHLLAEAEEARSKFYVARKEAIQKAKAANRDKVMSAAEAPPSGEGLWERVAELITCGEPPEKHASDTRKFAALYATLAKHKPKQ